MKTYAITGANRGIGLELARALVARGDAVVALCRSSSKELEATKARVLDGVDVSSDANIASVAERLSGTRVDVLVNNAGILERDTLDSFDHASLLRQMEVNALGPLRLTRALLPLMQRAGKVVVITSRMGSIADNGSGAYYGYRMSKAAVNAAFVSLARDLAPRGIAVGIFHPGMVATAMTGQSGIPAAESAKGLVARIDELDEARSGRFFHQNGEALPW
ncbi:MAG: SDR family oxidoreductase [Myxococcales bacterium]|nr:SDR family oxidoreductase [Myxococcales bacterium]